MQQEEWEPRITDFGLAKDVTSDSRFTASGTTLGTPQYMPPEQADGRLSEIDARSDVYSLGATLYEMLCSRPPFEGAAVINLIKQVILDDPVPPRKLNPSVPGDLETICLKCLEKDRERRYQSAGELEDDLRRFLEDEPIAARPASLLYRISKRVKRNPWLYATGAVAALLLAATGAFFLFVKPSMDRRPDREALAAALRQRLAVDSEVESRIAEAKILLGKANGRSARRCVTGSRSVTETGRASCRPLRT